MQEIRISMREVQGKSKKGLNFQHSILLTTDCTLFKEIYEMQ